MYCNKSNRCYDNWVLKICKNWVIMSTTGGDVHCNPLFILVGISLPKVSATASNPVSALMLFLPRERILRFFSPFRLAIFSMQFVDSWRCSHDVRVEREASIFSNIRAYNCTWIKNVGRKFSPRTTGKRHVMHVEKRHFLGRGPRPKTYISPMHLCCSQWVRPSTFWITWFLSNRYEDWDWAISASVILGQTVQKWTTLADRTGQRPNNGRDQTDLNILLFYYFSYPDGITLCYIFTLPFMYDVFRYSRVDHHKPFLATISKPYMELMVTRQPNVELLLPVIAAFKNLSYLRSMVDGTQLWDTKNLFLLVGKVNLITESSSCPILRLPGKQ